MPTCVPSHSVTDLPISPAGPCAVPCAGVTFALETIKSSTGSKGECVFSWTVVRTTRDPQGNIDSKTNFAGQASFLCSNSQTVTFYCDAAKACPAYELTLTCSEDAGPGGLGGSGG